MNTEFKLGTVSIMEIGEFLSKKLVQDGVDNNAELKIYLNEDEFKRVDEDLFYRMRENEEKEFEPSENEIMVNFDKVKVEIFKMQS